MRNKRCFKNDSNFLRFCLKNDCYLFGKWLYLTYKMVPFWQGTISEVICCDLVSKQKEGTILVPSVIKKEEAECSASPWKCCILITWSNAPADPARPRKLRFAAFASSEYPHASLLVLSESNPLCWALIRLRLTWNIFQASPLMLRRGEPHHEKVRFSQYLSHFLKITHLDAH